MKTTKRSLKPTVLELAAEERILARRETRMRLLLEDARDLERIQDSGHFRSRSCSSIREYGERILSLSARETSETLAIARVVRGFAEAEAALLTGRATPEALAALLPLVIHPEAQLPEDDWLGWAERESAKSLRKRVAKRLREMKVPRPPRRVILDLDEQQSQDLDDARVLASQSEKDLIGVTETVGTALRFFVKSKSPLERTPGQRRLPLGHNHNRTVPAEVDRETRRRAGNKCRLPYCDNDIFVDAIHVFEDHVDGGPTETWNMDRHCKPHHRMQGRGQIRNDGTTEVPKFVDDRGVPLDQRWIVLRRAHPDSPMFAPLTNGAESTGPPSDSRGAPPRAPSIEAKARPPPT